MQTKAFAIIAAASLAISLGWTAAGNSQDQGMETQGKEVCRQSLLRLAHLGLETLPASQTVKAFGKKDWRQMSLTEKRLYVRALATFHASLVEGFEIMTLRKVNSCPQDWGEKPWDSLTEEDIRRDEDDVARAQIRLALEQAKSLD